MGVVDEHTSGGACAGVGAGISAARDHHADAAGQPGSVLHDVAGAGVGAASAASRVRAYAGAVAEPSRVVGTSSVGGVRVGASGGT